MNFIPKTKTWRWLAATLLILSMALSSLATAISVKAQVAPQVVAQHPLTNSRQVAAPLAPRQIENFDDLPLGLAPAVAQALADDLPASFHLRVVKDGYQADNPAHGLTTTFGSTGLQMTIGGETWGLTLTGMGREGAVQALPIAEPVADGARIEYRYPGLVEWYLNTNWGLEQGFTLQARPVGEGDLKLELAMSGSLQASLQDDTTLLLSNATGQTIARYTGLHAYDANGRQLPAYLSISSLSISIVVDDSDTVYPITIDPWMQRAKLTPSDAQYQYADDFGSSVSISGDTVMIGAPGDTDNGLRSGSVYVFVKPEYGWSAAMNETAKLLASDGERLDGFGATVAISGDTVVVGAAADDDNGDDSGSAYIFVKPAGGWAGTVNESAKLLPSDGEQNEWFGHPVAISGDTVVIGTVGDTENELNSGSAYVFTEPDGGWLGVVNESAKLLPSDGERLDEFGHRVTISGDTIVVGSPKDDDNAYNSGSAYIFVEPADGWSGILNESAKLLPSEIVFNALFGWSIAINADADTLVITALSDPDNLGPAYIFIEPVGGWSGTLNESAKLLASDDSGYDYFGWSVAISGDADTVIVGSKQDNDNGTNSGSVYVFEEPVGGWSGVLNEATKLLASDGLEYDYFGRSVAIDRDTDTVVVGNNRAAYYGHSSAYVFGDLPMFDLAVTKDVTPAAAAPGETITYTLGFSNVGAFTATHSILSDTVPVSVIVQGVVSSGVAITDTGALSGYVWTVEDLSVGEWGVITITGVLSDPLAAGTFTNTATITCVETESDYTNNQSAASLTVLNVAPIAVGDAYTITEDLPLIVAAPGVLTNDSDANSDLLMAILDSLPPNGELDLVADGSFVYTPNLNFNGTDVFIYHAYDGDAHSNVVSVMLSVTATNDAPVAVDDTFVTTYETSLVITAPGVLENDTDVEGNSLTAVLDSNPLGDLALSADGYFVYTPTDGFTGADTFTYHASDGLDDSNVATVTINVLSLTDVDLEMIKTVDHPTPNEDDTIIYTLQVTNNGPANATGIWASDILPAGVSYLTDDGVGAYNPTTGAWDVGDLLASDSAILHISATVDAGTAGTVISNTAAITQADQNDPVPGNDNDVAVIMVALPGDADLGVVKSVDNPTPGEGDAIVYTLLASNHGPSDATGVAVSDMLPAGVTFTSDDGGGYYNSATGVWNLLGLAVDADATLHISATVDEGTAGMTITNTAAINGDQADPNAANDEDSAAITVIEPACVEIADASLNYTNTGTIYTDTIIYFQADLLPEDAGPDYHYIITIDGEVGEAMSSGTEPLAFQHTFDVSGTHAVEIAVWNCDMTVPNLITDALEVEIYEPVTCVNLESISILGEATGYTGVVYTFGTEYSPTGASQPIDYLWGSGENTDSITHTFDVTGTYTLSVTANNCQSAEVVDEHVIIISDVLPSYTLTVLTDPIDGGTVTLDPPGGMYDQGIQVELTANSASGYEFSSWSGSLTGSDNPATITITQDLTITAHFQLTNYNLFLPIIVKND